MNCADSGAGEHGNRRFRNHRHINRNPVALFHAELFQCVGKYADPFVQLAVTDALIAGRVIALPDNRRLVGFLRKVAINTVVANIETAVRVPADMQVVALERYVFDFAKWFYPVHAGPGLAPETFVVLHRPAIHFLIFRCVDMRRTGETVGHRINLDVHTIRSRLFQDCLNHADRGRIVCHRQFAAQSESLVAPCRFAN